MATSVSAFNAEGRERESRERQDETCETAHDVVDCLSRPTNKEAQPKVRNGSVELFQLQGGNGLYVS